jgi:hypothetical protein
MMVSLKLIAGDVPEFKVVNKKPLIPNEQLNDPFYLFKIG